MDRLGQWSSEETRELLASRSELDRLFLETKRNRHLWAAVSSRMEMKGFRRSPDQCKCKWKNLVTRYKAIEGGAKRQFAFYDDVKRIFSAREENPTGSGEGVHQAGSEDEGEMRKRRKDGGGSGAGPAETALTELMAWQAQEEAARVRGSMEREAERREKEVECRLAMESLVVEKAVFDQGRRREEEERWMREEVRAQRWDALVSSLFERIARRKSS